MEKGKLKKNLLLGKKKSNEINSIDKKRKIDGIKLNLILDSDEIEPYSLLSREDSLRLESIEKELNLLRPLSGFLNNTYNSDYDNTNDNIMRSTNTNTNNYNDTDYIKNIDDNNNNNNNNNNDHDKEIKIYQSKRKENCLEIEKTKEKTLPAPQTPLTHVLGDDYLANQVSTYVHSKTHF